MKRGHRPLRTCRACGRKAHKLELIRWVALRNEIVEDVKQDIPGRGVYCCPGSKCRLHLLKNKKKLNMLLRLKG